MLRRRAFLCHTAASSLALMPLMSQAAELNAAMPTRPIPVDQSPLPILGLGTWSRFGDDAASREVLAAWAKAGGRVIDSSPMYGAAEAAVGRLSTELQLADSLFMASKVWTTGREAGVAEINASIRNMGRLDLLQIHNLLDWQTHIETLRALKAERRIRYIGLTHYHEGAHAEMERLLRQLKPDFIQINLSLAERQAEDRLLPAAADAGVAVLINRPFAEGALFETVRGVELPEAAKQLGIQSWAQLFLAYALSHPSVTCVLAATKKVQHLQDNLAAASVPALSAPQRLSLLKLWQQHRVG